MVICPGFLSETPTIWISMSTLIFNLEGVFHLGTQMWHSQAWRFHNTQHNSALNSQS